MNSAKFNVGDIVRHRKFGYRGAVCDVDAQFSLSEEWYDKVALSRPPKAQPWYHVLVDGQAHTTYVAERHLAPLDGGQISHPLLGQFFTSYDGSRYRPHPAH